MQTEMTILLTIRITLISHSCIEYPFCQSHTGRDE